MNRRTFIANAVAILVASRAAVAQPKKARRIGFLLSTSPSTISDRIEAFRLGLRELGYVEGQDIVVEYRWAEGMVERLPGLATELVRLEVEVIVTAGPTVTRYAKQATSRIPIVMGFDSDPVADGFVASLARPGGNITGLSTLHPQISGKQLELLKAIVPRLSRAAVLGTSTQPGTTESLRATERTAGVLGVQLQFIDVPGPNDIETAFREAGKARTEGILALSSRVLVAHRARVADLAARSRFPVIYSQSEHVQDGGLMSYGVNYPDLFRRAAGYVDKILRGRNPAELPVEQPTKFELVINLNAARQIGLTIPQPLLLTATQVIH